MIWPSRSTGLTRVNSSAKTWNPNKGIMTGRIVFFFYPAARNPHRAALKLFWRLVIQQHVSRTVNVFVFCPLSAICVCCRGGESTKCVCALHAKRAIFNRHWKLFLMSDGPCELPHECSFKNVSRNFPWTPRVHPQPSYKSHTWKHLFVAFHHIHIFAMKSIKPIEISVTCLQGSLWK